MSKTKANFKCSRVFLSIFYRYIILSDNCHCTHSFNAFRLWIFDMQRTACRWEVTCLRAAGTHFPYLL